MEEQQDKLETLTSQPISVKIGENEYQIRRMTAADFVKIKRKIKEFEENKEMDSAEAGIQTICFALSVLLVLEPPLTPEAISQMIYIEQFEDVSSKLGLKKPQIAVEENNSKNSTGASSTQPS